VLAMKASTTFATFQVLSALVILVIGSCIYVWVSLSLDPIYTSCIAGNDRPAPLHTAFYWMRWGVSQTFCPGLASNCDPPDLHLLFKKLFPIPICSSVFPTASWSCFKVSDLTLRSLIHYELILVQGEK
jgi:hypothetical protein